MYLSEFLIIYIYIYIYVVKIVVFTFSSTIILQFDFFKIERSPTCSSYHVRLSIYRAYTGYPNIDNKTNT